VVESHRGRFGVDVEITRPVAGVKAFINFVLLDFMPSGELRLDARGAS
jgi:hypothetical protein